MEEQERFREAHGVYGEKLCEVYLFCVFETDKNKFADVSKKDDPVNQLVRSGPL